jgi:hypothetical protein
MSRTGRFALFATALLCLALPAAPQTIHVAKQTGHCKYIRLRGQQRHQPQHSKMGVYAKQKMRYQDNAVYK